MRCALSGDRGCIMRGARRHGTIGRATSFHAAPAYARTIAGQRACHFSRPFDGPTETVRTAAIRLGI